VFLRKNTSGAQTSMLLDLIRYITRVIRKIQALIPLQIIETY